jgi:two-component system sensor histidine kinase DesK
MSVEMPDSAKSKEKSLRRLRTLTLAYLLMYPAPWLLGGPTPDSKAIIASLLAIGVFLALYFHGYFLRGWSRLCIAAAMVGIGFSLSPYGGLWNVFIVYAASLAGFGRPMRVGVVGVAGVLATTILAGFALGLSPMEWGAGIFFGAILGLAGIFISEMGERSDELAEAREATRQFAIIAERERIARDLHDVLGHTLTLVAVKADLARKLIERDPAGAAREIHEIHAAARGALGEVRAAVTGMRSTTLATELAAARSSLESAGIRVESTATTEPLPPLIETALAYVIREAATNVIRHSGATHCRITIQRDVDRAHLEIQDDGRGGAVVEGNGVTGIRQRLAPLRGVLDLSGTAGMSLRASVPLGEAAP